jgi:4-phytase / acid phosphatase
MKPPYIVWRAIGSIATSLGAALTLLVSSHRSAKCVRVPNGRCTVLFLIFLLFAIAGAGSLSAQSVSGRTDDTVLKQIILFGRHGVRSAVLPEAKLAPFATRPYPDFGVPPGYLTPHGAQAVTLLGSYFREYLLHEGLLTGNASEDAKRAYFRANSIQRSNVTATTLAAALFPGASVPVHSYPLGQADPIFDPIGAKVVSVDGARAEREVTGIFNDGAALQSAYSGEFSLIRSALFGYKNGVQPPPATPAGLTDATAGPIPLTVNTTGAGTGNVINAGGISATLVAADPFVMEYTDGLPLKDVGWGELSLDTLSQQTRILTLNMAIEFLPPYLNQLQSSNAGAHVLRSLEQAATGKRVPGAFGDAKDRVLVINSSDGYVAGLAGLLHLHWLLPGYQPDFCPPGGALVFELRQAKGGGEHFVRVYFTAQTFDQLRNLTPLTLDQPPATVQLLVPNGGNTASTLDVKFSVFEDLLKRSIDAKDAQDPAKESPPGPLTGVPLQ